MKRTFFAVVLAICFGFATAKLRKKIIPNAFRHRRNALHVLKKTFSAILLFVVCVKFGYFARSFSGLSATAKETKLKKDEKWKYLQRSRI